MNNKGQVKEMLRCIIPGCKRSRLARFYVCRECAIEHGTYKQPYKTWPEWLKFLCNEQQKMDKRRKSKYYVEEIPVDPIVLERIIEKKQSNNT